MRAPTLIVWACRLRRPGIVFTPSVRSLALVLVFVLLWTASRGAVTVVGGAAQLLTVLGVGVVAAVLNASVLLRDLGPIRRGALRYYGFGLADFIVLYAVAALPLTVLEAACGTLVLDLPGWSEPSRFGMLLAAWTATTALTTAAVDRLRGGDAAAGWPVPTAGAGPGACATPDSRVRRGGALRSLRQAPSAGPRRRLPVLGFNYLRSASRWPLLIAAAEGVLVAYVLGRLGQPLATGVYVAGVYLVATVICVLAEVDDTVAARFSRSRYAITDAELWLAKLILAGPLLAGECVTAGLVGLEAGAPAGAVGLLGCLLYLPLVTTVLADVATAYTRRHRMLPAAELGGLLIALVPVLSLVVFPAAAYLLRRSEHA